MRAKDECKTDKYKIIGMECDVCECTNVKERNKAKKEHIFQKWIISLYVCKGRRMGYLF